MPAAPPANNAYNAVIPRPVKPMTPLRVLFPIDGSEPTYQAVDGALGYLAGHPDAEATFLVVMSRKVKAMPEHAREHLTYDDEDEIFLRDDEVKAVFTKASGLAKNHRFAKVETRKVVGDVFEEILKAAHDHDVLVMHRLDPQERREKVRGSLTEKIARAAPCDVWLIDSD